MNSRKILVFIYSLSFYANLGRADADLTSTENTSLGNVGEALTTTGGSVNVDQAPTTTAGSQNAGNTPTTTDMPNIVDENSAITPRSEQDATDKPDGVSEKIVVFKDYHLKALDLHNLLRAKHPGTPPMELDNVTEILPLGGPVTNNLNTAAFSCALRYATDGVGKEFCFDKGTIKCEDGKTPGENAVHYENSNKTANPSDSDVIEMAINGFYAEKDKYNYNSPTTTNETSNFTQLTWASSKLLGVGLGRGPHGEYGISIMYCPPGNQPNEFKENVKPGVIDGTTRLPSDTTRLPRRTSTVYGVETSTCKCAGIAISPETGLVLLALVIGAAQ